MPKVTGNPAGEHQVHAGVPRARDTSIDSMIACGTDERSSLQCTARGSITSSAKRVRPVTLGAPVHAGAACR